MKNEIRVGLVIAAVFVLIQLLRIIPISQSYYILKYVINAKIEKDAYIPVYACKKYTNRITHIKASNLKPINPNRQM